MKLQASVNNETYMVEIKREGQRVFAKIDDREYELEVSIPEPSVYLLKHEGKVHELYVSPKASPDSPIIVSSRKGDIEVTLIDPKRLRGAGGAAGAADGVAEIKTMMPGKVVRIVTPVGEEVEKGTAVLVVEAMKMQNDLKAPKSGVVKEIRVEEGATVAAGDVLAIIE